MKRLNLDPNKVSFVLFIILLALLMIALLSNCALMKLERTLEPGLREWYAVHSVLMDYPVPDNLANKPNETERGYFLRLPVELQRRYREMFWSMRHPDAKPLFQARLNYVLHIYPEGMRAAPARTLILCGLPDEIYLYDPNGQEHWASTPTDTQGYNSCITIWVYLFNNQELVNYGWEFDGLTWRHYSIGVPATSGQTRMELWWRWWFSPWEIGWDSWRAVVKQAKEG